MNERALSLSLTRDWEICQEKETHMGRDEKRDGDEKRDRDDQRDRDEMKK